MSDNPMYWPGHQRPTWHQQPPSAQPVNPMSHYANHPGSILGNSMATGMPGDPALQMQSSLAGRHQPHQSTLTQHQSTLGPPGSQSSLYPSMMPTPGGVPSAARPSMTSNSHLSSTNQGMPPHPSMQQPTHPQSHYSPHQYSSIASAYWNPPPMNSQSNLGPSGASSSSSAAQSAGPPPPPSQTDGTSSYHSSSSPLAMPNDVRGSISTNSSANMQQNTSSFHSPKDIQSSSDHIMSYDRQRSSMSQQPQQHPSTMMPQNVPSSTASNLSPNQSQLSMQGRLQSQTQLDSMRSMSQQPNAVSNWSSSYYGQQSQTPYSNVMNPYMPYSGSSSVPNHGPASGQTPVRPAMGQKPPANGGERARAAYPTHATSMYGQPPPPTGSTNGSYYGYDSYYNQVASQAPSDPYLTHQNQGSASQHWPASGTSNQMISNSAAGPGSIQPQLRPQTGSSTPSIHPQSPSASSTLPSLSSRPPPPSQTPDRSPAPQHSTSYPSPSQQGSSTKSTSNSLAQLEQMVMPNSGQQSAAPAIKSPTQRSSTNSPSANAQQQLQYSYNSSGQGSYFSTGSGSNSTQAASYYPPYDSGSLEAPKPAWSEQLPGGPMVNPMGPSSGNVMVDNSQSSYGQAGYDGSTSYNEYTPLSSTTNSMASNRFPSSGDTTEPHPSEKGDPYNIDSQTFDDFDDPSAASKSKKGRAKKGEEKVKKERKPRAPRAPKASSSGVQPPSPSASLQPLQTKPPSLSHTPDISSGSQQTSSNLYPSPNQKSTMKPLTDTPPQSESLMLPSSATTIPISKSPVHRLSTESPNGTQQQMQYSYNSSGQPSYYNSAASVGPSPPNYYPPSTYETSSSIQKSWPEQPPDTQMTTVPTVTPTAENSQTTYNQQNYDGPSSYGGEFTTLSTPSNNSNQQQFSVASDTPEVPQQETSGIQTPDPQVPEDGSELSSKTKQRRSKKGAEDKPKKERKPRAAKTAKGSSSVQSTSPISTTPVQGLSAPPQDGVSMSPGNSYANQQGYPPLPESIGQNQETNASAMSAGRFTPTSSPVNRLSTESPNATMPSQPQYTYNSQANYFNAGGTGQNSAQFYPQYESGSSDIRKPWSEAVDSSAAPAPPVVQDQNSLQHSSTMDNDNAFSNYASMSSSSKARPTSNEDTLLPTAENIAEEQPSEIKDADDTLEAPIPTPAKPKKSRSKKTEERGDRAKKERKPRSKAAAAATAPPQTQSVPELPAISPQPDETTTDPVASQSTSDSTPAEPKPKRIRIRDSSSKGKKKLPKFALKFAKTKKRKRLGSSDNDQSDLEKTPPPSPDEVETGVQKRRSARNTKKLKYNVDMALGFSESDDDSQIMPKTKKVASTTVNADGETTTVEETVIADEPTVFAAPVEDTMVVEKIMSSRTGKRELEPEPGEVLPPDGTHIEVEEFYVKYKNLSYLHCDWRTLEELEKGDRRVAQKIKRYKQKKDSSNLFSFMDEDLFDAQYCEVDRILAVNEVEEMVPDSDDDEKVDKQATKDNPELAKDATLNPVETKQEAVLSSTDGADVSNSLIPIDTAKAIKGSSDIEIQNEDDRTKTSDSDKAEIDIMSEKSEVQPDISVDKPLKTQDEASVEKAQDDPMNGGEPTIEEVKTDLEAKKSETAIVEAVALPEESVSNVENANSEKPTEEIIEKPKKMKKKISRHYLVKWRGLSYEDSTWELEDDLDPDKIKHFQRFKDPPPKSKWKSVKRPKPEEWVRKEVSPVYKNNNTLREYQLEGINWLSFCWHQGRNCILADEMGLGKTIQSIAFVNEIYQYGIYGPFLIIVPLSTVGNWAREFETWTDLNVITYHGGSTSREMLKEYEMFYRNDQGNRITSYYKFQVMITTFEIILSDCLDLREIPWRCCIIDEAHRLKNRNCKLLEGLRLLNMEHRVLLTGTPLQNNVEELFSLLNFLEPTQFSSTEQFLQEFGDLKTEAQVDKLKLILKPMMLRRLKEDVEKSLAPKEETIVEVELTNIQKKYYRAILEKNFSFLTKGSSNNNMPNLMNTMMELRKCCIHPYLINGAEEQIMYEARQAKLAGGEPMSSFQAMVNSSGKLVLIDKLLPRLRADGHRVLIFSQMVRCLDILEDYVTHKHYPFERIDGRVRGSDRQQAIDRFSKPGSDRFVFLLCTRAGGLGINLTAADTVIIFDSDWNPQNDLQAQARCHRIGQSKAVKIYRLICRNTYEREMFDKASLKLGLDKAVLQSMNTQKGGAGGIDGQLTKKEIEELLRKGAYGALMDDDNAGDKFCEEDIDQILQRRTQVITIDNSEAKGSTFSKATFSSSNNREDIELDDPNFWEKWAKKANIDSDELRSQDELIQLAPRRRTQTKRYGADGTLIDISDLDSSEEDEETISMRTRGSRGRQPKLTPSSTISKRSKRNRMFEYDDDDFLAGLEAGYWSKGDCLKVEKGLLTYGWGRWDKIIAGNRYKREITPEECESICRVMLLYCLNNYKGDEKIKSFAWELITPPDDANKSQSDLDTSTTSTRGRKPKSAPVLAKKTTAEEIADAAWTKEAKNDPLIALPDDQYRRHLQRNSNRLLIRMRFLHYLKDDILKGYTDKIMSDCNASEVDLPPVPVDGDLPAPWWDDDADKSLLIGIFKHGHDKFNLMRQDPNLCFLHKCGPPNKEELLAEMSFAERNAEDLDDDNRDLSVRNILGLNREIMCQEESDACDCLDDLLNNVVKDLSDGRDSIKDSSNDVVDENKNSILKVSNSQDSLDDTFDNEVNEMSQTTIKMDIDDEESLTNETSVDASMSVSAKVVTDMIATDGFSPFPSANDLNQRFRRLITAYQRNSKKLEIKLAQKARDELKKERTSKFEAARHEREERKRSQAQKWSKGHEADFLRAISSFGVEYDPVQKKHDWNKFRSVGKLDKKLDETLDEYYKAFIVMCKKATSKPLTADEENCPIIVEPLSEERASRCLSRIELLSKIREQIITHPALDERLKLCHSQSDLPDWWENGLHDKDLLLAAAKHGLTRLDHNLAHDPTLSFNHFIRQKVEQLISQPPASKLSIPLAQLQDLLERNGIEYLDIKEDAEDVQAAIDSILDRIDSEEAQIESGYKSFVDLVDGPHSKSDESMDKSPNQKASPKTTRSSSIISSSSSAKQGANIVTKTDDPPSLRLASSSRVEHTRLVEITPIPPNKIPDELTKNLEAGDLLVTIQSESALLQLYNRDPIMLFGSTNPITLKIRWLRDKAIQTRLENLVYLVENGHWPMPPRAPNSLSVGQSIPTISLPNPMTSSLPTGSIGMATGSPSKSEKLDAPLSPKSDISNISSRASKQDTKDIDPPVTTRGRRGRARRSRQLENEPSGTLPLAQHDLDPLKDDGQATAKLRNLLSQGPSSSKTVYPSGDKLMAKFGGNKQGAGLSSLLASFKQKRSDGSGSFRGRDDKNLLDLNAPGTANLLPQILANMKPEFRDLLSNQDTAAMLINSLTSMGSGNMATNLRSSLSSSQATLDALQNLTKSSAKGPPPAHQRSDNPPTAHGGASTTRELRRNSQNAREGSPPSINLRSTRGKGSLVGMDDMSSHRKVSEMAHGKLSSGKKRGRPSSSTSDSPPGAPGADVLDLSALHPTSKSGSSRSESRSRRHRDHQPSDDAMPPGSGSRVSTKASLKSGGKQASSSSPNQQESEQQAEKGGRTTRASKRIGSRIDALALNLQAKRLNRGDSPTSDISPPLPKEKSCENLMAAHGSSKSPSDQKLSSSKAPPAAHSGSHKTTSSSSTTIEQTPRDKPNQTPPTSLSNQSASSSTTRTDPLSQFMSNPSSLLAGLNPGALGGAGDLMNQLLRKAGTNDIVKNLLNEFVKNPSLALDPNILATLTAGSMPMVGQGLPGFNLPQQAATTLASTSNKNTASSLLTDFKLPSSNSLMKKSRQESSSSSGGSRHSTSQSNAPAEGRRSSSTPDRHDRRSSSSSSSSSTDKRSSYSSRGEKHGKHEGKRSGGSSQQEPSNGDQSSRRSSSSLLAHQVPTTQQTSHIQTPATSTPLQSSLPNPSALNLASQFGGLNSFGGLLGLPGMNELMKQMGNFPGLATNLPRVSNAPVVSNAPPTSSSNLQPPADKANRRSRQSSGGGSSTQTTSSSSLQQQQQQAANAANAALANSIMNLASQQPSAASNPYNNYANPLANPFLPFNLAGLGMNNPLGMGLFPNLYMPQGFPTPDQTQQQQQQPSTQTSNQLGGSSENSGSKDKKMRYSRK